MKLDVTYTLNVEHDEVIAMAKIISNLSRNAMADIGLSDNQIEIVLELYKKITEVVGDL